jgi:hypothetical protein
MTDETRRSAREREVTSVATKDSGNKSRTRRESTSTAKEFERARNPHPEGSANYVAFERMQDRRERDAKFAQTAAGKRSYEHHNAHLAEVTGDANSSAAIDEDGGFENIVELEGRDDPSNPVDLGGSV